MKLYIDPGTGSMLFTILIGIFGTVYFLIRLNFVKFKMWITGGKDKDISTIKHPLVIFTDHKRYWNIFEPICRELDKRGFDILYMTASEDDPALDAGLEHMKGIFVGEGNKAFSKLNFIRATIVLSTTPGIDVYQWKKSKEVDCYIHIFHAASDVNMYRMFGIDYYDALIVSGDYQTEQIRELEKVRNLPEKEIVKLGLPYMDEMAKRLAQAEPLPEHERTVLLAPSWGKSAILNVYGGKIIDELIKTGYKIIIRPHPQSFTSEKELMDDLMKKYPETDKLKWNRDNDNFDVLRESDILISDFSGVVFDFSLVYDKPVICTDTQFDRGPLDAWWVKSPLWTMETLPKIGETLTADSLGNIKEVIDRCLTDTRYQAGRDEARAETWANIGNGTKLVADYIIEKYESLNKKESA